MKKLVLLIIVIAGISLVGCNNNTNNITECYHTPPCKTFREHDLLVLKESEQDNYIEDKREYINYNIYTDEDNNYKENKQIYYRVITGSYANKDNANKHVQELIAKNIDCFISEAIVDGQVRYRIVTGSFSNKDNAQNHSNMLNKLGYETFITEYTN